MNGVAMATDYYSTAHWALRICGMAAILGFATASPPALAGGLNRRIPHTRAYLARPELGHYVSIKVTPPEQRGQKGHVLVEVYNFTNRYLSVVDFDIVLHNDMGMRVESHIFAEDLKPNWSALKWVQIPEASDIPKIDAVSIQRMFMFTDEGKRIRLRFYTDLIKE